MRHVDWPLAIMLAIMFVVMSALRWRYFMRRAARGGKPGGPRPGGPE